MTDAWSRLVTLASREIDGAWLALFRVLFGVTMSVSALRFLAYGWVDRFYVRPHFHFTYFGFEWVEPLPGPAMHAVFWALAALGLAIALGLFFRLSAVLFVALFTYVQLVDATMYLNHYYAACLFGLLLAISPAGRVLSIDAGREGVQSTVPAGWLYLVRFQVGVVYTFAGLAKATPDWLLHAQPLGIWLGSSTDLPIVGAFFAWDSAPLAMSWAGFLFDTTVVWFLLWRRTRVLAFAAVVVFHAMTSILFPIGMFPWIMVTAALVFFPPGLARAIFDRIVRPRPIDGIRARPSRFRHAFVALALAYCAVQVAIPLRTWAYGGNVLWHEQGMRFSWRVMVREKNGSVTYELHNPRTGRRWEVRPRDYLTALQEREMSGQPDLILQLAHRVRDDAERREGGPVEVRVRALVSLNGRRAAPLVDPDRDLAAVHDGFADAEWILAPPAGPPPPIRPI
jgi:vitamin K-dependent gamma-carboxylase